MEPFVDKPIWAFHGANDSLVKPEMSRDVVEAIKAKGGRRVQLTVYPFLDHDSWTITYTKRKLYSWLLDQHLPSKETEGHSE